jgi:hypothetical protein
MSAVLNFDASQVAPDTGAQDALPAGWYDVVMEASEMKPTKDNTGAYLECKLNVIAPQNFQGKKIYTRLNLRNSNATAQEIGYKQLSAICHAVGVLQVADSAQLHNIPFKVKLKLRPAEGPYEASNDVTAYKNINEQVGVPAVAGFPAASAAPAAPMAPPSFAAPAAPLPPAAAPAPAPAAQQWQQPQAPQPWQQPQAPAAAAPQMPAQQPAPAQAPAWNQQAPMQQPMQPQAPVQQAPNPAVAQAQGAVPPWMQGAPAAPAA